MRSNDNFFTFQTCKLCIWSLKNSNDVQEQASNSRVLKSEVHSHNINLLISNLDVVCREEDDKFGHNKATKGIILIHVFSSIFNHGWESDNSC